MFELVKKIPKGKVTTYKILAKKLRMHPRKVGIILKSNKELIKIPCHRVVCSNGMIGGYMAGKRKKIELLKKEGIKIVNERIVNLKDIIFEF